MESSAALAVLEVRVHLDLPLDLLPDDYVLLTIDLGDMMMEKVAAIPASPQDFGDRWLREKRTSLLQVPSILVPESANLLLNALHPDTSNATIVQKRRFSFDPRLW
jgi:RES domain-containing protein